MYIQKNGEKTASSWLKVVASLVHRAQQVAACCMGCTSTAADDIFQLRSMAPLIHLHESQYMSHKYSKTALFQRCTHLRSYKTSLNKLCCSLNNSCWPFNWCLIINSDGTSNQQVLIMFFTVYLVSYEAYNFSHSFSQFCHVTQQSKT